ncbi:hypothetical protein [Polaromonas jejuensis]|uniref:Rap1a immunity protein domain-containing protein n=1 Tax=Polaromonas jejuensis TaxID=457502 RepID=A0ABW0QCL7_9BURK|nr:hypothetical protein [Polaromonas jejuensis]
MKPLKTAMLFPVLVLCVLGAEARASDQAGKYSVRGSISCAQFLNEQKINSGAHTSHLGYVAGYLSAYNLQTPGTYDILGGADFDGAILWIKNYCDRQPLETVGHALMDLTAELFPKRLQKAP